MLLVKENPLLTEVEAMQKCYKVLDLICENCMKQREMNEVLAVKMHYLSCIFQKCILFLKEREDKLDGLIKRYDLMRNYPESIGMTLLHVTTCT